MEGSDHPEAASRASGAQRARAAAAVLLCVGACFAAAAIGQVLSGSEPGDWYGRLRKPSFTPPGWLFGPVWTLLYTGMGLSAWLVWRTPRRRAARRWALAVFAVQLLLNAAWPGVFFGLHLPGPAFGEILVLWAAAAATMVLFFRLSAPAGWLMVPYLVWLTFAAVLNGAIWRLNA